MSTEAGKTTQEATAEALRSRASQAYASCSREAQEDKWILDHLPLVRHIVQKVAAHLSHKTDMEDLVSAGTLGLVKAARAFDPARDAEFKTYAYIRIRGAVIDELRGRSFVPAAVHNHVRHIQRMFRKFTTEHGRFPTDEELAAEAGVSPAQLYRMLQEVRRQHFLSIHGLSDDHPVLGAFVPPDSSPGPDAQVERNEMIQKMTQAIQELPQKDRVILLLYYERDLTMKETGKVLGITESRVSQLHASALFKLSMKLKGAA